MSFKRTIKDFKKILYDFYEKPYTFVKNRRVNSMQAIILK